MANRLDQIDLQLTRRLANLLTSDREGVDIRPTSGRDVATISGQENLAQAVVNRLLTRRGELAQLGHADYGSRLYQLIGELNNRRTRVLAEVYVRECLIQEGRIEEIRSVVIAPPASGRPDVLEVTLAVKPVGQEQELSLSLSLNLGG